MIVTVQFKNKDKVFSGKTYDYILNKKEKLQRTLKLVFLEKYARYMILIRVEINYFIITK